MKTNFKLMVMASVALLAMNACSDDYDSSSEDESSASGVPVTFEMGINTLSRTSYATSSSDYSSDFTSGDEVGIFADGTTSYTNVEYTLGSDGSWAATDGTGITVEVGDTYNFYAYYPFDEEGGTDATSMSFTVSSDQSTDSYEGSDVLYAAATDMTIDESAKVELTYDHAFSLVQVELSGDLSDDVSSVTLKNVYKNATVDLTSGDVTLSGTTGDVIMNEFDADEKVYRAIVPAQTIDANTSILVISTSDGSNYSFSYDQDVPYEQGKVRKFEVDMNARTLTVVSGSINTWDESDEMTGNSSVEEVVATVTSVNLNFGSGSDDTATYVQELEYTTLSGSWVNVKVPEGDEMAWYLRDNNQGYTTPSINADEGYLELYNTARGSYNNNALICHFPGPFERGSYSVSITVSSDAISYTYAEDGTTVESSTDSGIVGIGFSNADDSEFFRLFTSSNTSWQRNLTTFGTIGETASAKTFCVDFSKSYTSGGTTGIAEDSYNSTSSSDLDAINIVLYNYTSAVLPSSLYITNISLEYMNE